MKSRKQRLILEQMDRKLKPLEMFLYQTKGVSSITRSFPSTTHRGMPFTQFPFIFQNLNNTLPIIISTQHVWPIINKR